MRWRARRPSAPWGGRPRINPFDCHEAIAQPYDSHARRSSAATSRTSRGRLQPRLTIRSPSYTTATSNASVRNRTTHLAWRPSFHSSQRVVSTSHLREASTKADGPSRLPAGLSSLGGRNSDYTRPQHLARQGSAACRSARTASSLGSPTLVYALGTRRRRLAACDQPIPTLRASGCKTYRTLHEDKAGRSVSGLL